MEGIIKRMILGLPTEILLIVIPAAIPVMIPAKHAQAIKKQNVKLASKTNSDNSNQV